MIDLDQPWIPPGTTLPKIGSRVIVRLSGECRFPTKPIQAAVVVEHYPEQDNMEGVIIQSWVTPRHSDHPHLVYFDTVCTLGGWPVRAGFFAAAELEILA